MYILPASHDVQPAYEHMQVVSLVLTIPIGSDDENVVLMQSYDGPGAQMLVNRHYCALVDATQPDVLIITVKTRAYSQMVPFDQQEDFSFRLRMVLIDQNPGAVVSITIDETYFVIADAERKTPLARNGINVSLV
jgi:hypothetical protein